MRPDRNLVNHNHIWPWADCLTPAMRWMLANERMAALGRDAPVAAAIALARYGGLLVHEARN